MGIRKKLGLGLALLSVVACSWQKKEEDLDSESVKVQIPVSKNGEYRLEVVELFTLKNLTHLEGTAARFYTDPDTVSGSLKGRNPEIRYIRDTEGVIVAKDALSLQMLTTYAHLEMLQKLEHQSGAEGVLTYPRKVAVNVSFRNSSEKSQDGAFYSGKFDAILMVPFTQPTLPLMANAGVIAHEHFHAIFQKLVVDALKDLYPENPQASLHGDGGFIDAKSDDKKTKYHAVFLRGLNEGLADVWGWIYSGDNLFVGRSLPAHLAIRRLDAKPLPLDSSIDLKSAVNGGDSDEALVAQAYTLGTKMALAIRGFATQYSGRKNQEADQIRIQIAQWVVSTLPLLKKDYESLKENEYLSLSRVAGLFAEQVPDLKEADCDYFINLMAREDQLPAFTKKCAGLKKKEKEPLP